MQSNKNDFPDFPKNRTVRQHGCLGSILTLIILILIASCSVTKKHTYTKSELTHIIDSVKANTITNTVDTLKVFKDRVITKEIQSVIEVQVDCDSLGNVKDVNYNVKSGNNQFKAFIKNNKLSLSIKLDSVSNIYESKYKSKYTKDSINLHQKYNKLFELKEKEVIVKEPFWLNLHWKCVLIIAALVSIIILVLRIKK